MVKVLRNIVLKVTPKPATGSKNPIRPHSLPCLAVHRAIDPAVDPPRLGKPEQTLAAPGQPSAAKDNRQRRHRTLPSPHRQASQPLLSVLPCHRRKPAQPARQRPPPHRTRTLGR